MKKTIITLALGIMIGAAPSVMAEIDSLIGKEVQGETTVIVDGQTLADKVVIIDNKSYGPVRAIGEAAGLEVGFVDGQVVLSSQVEQEEEPVTDTPQEVPQTTPDVPVEGEVTNEKIAEAEKSLNMLMQTKRILESTGKDTSEVDALISEAEKSLNELKAQLAQ